MLEFSRGALIGAALCHVQRCVVGNSWAKCNLLPPAHTYTAALCFAICTFFQASFSVDVKKKKKKSLHSQPRASFPHPIST